MQNLIKKITSRKFLLSVAGIATGVALALGVDASEIETVAGAVVSIISVVTYIVVEGKVDAESVKNAIEATQDALEVITDKEV